MDIPVRERVIQNVARLHRLRCCCTETGRDEKQIPHDDVHRAGVGRCGGKGATSRNKHSPGKYGAKKPNGRYAADRVQAIAPKEKRGIC